MAPQVPYKYYSWEIATNLTKTKKSASSLGERLAEHFVLFQIRKSVGVQQVSWEQNFKSVFI